MMSTQRQTAQGSPGSLATWVAGAILTGGLLLLAVAILFVGVLIDRYSPAPDWLVVAVLVGGSCYFGWRAVRP